MKSLARFLLPFLPQTLLATDLITSGTVAGRQIVTLDASNIANLRGNIQGSAVQLTATQDIKIEGGTVGAKDLLVLDAGRDLTVQSSVSDHHVQLQNTPTLAHSG